MTNINRPQLLGLLLCGMLLHVAATPLLAADAAIALRGATVITGSADGTIEDATVLIQDGQIVEVGTDVSIPLTARIHDVHDCWIMSGLIDPYHSVNLRGLSSGSSRTVSIQGQTIVIRSSGGTSATSFVRIGDNLDPIDAEFPTHRRSGVTLLHLVSGGYGQAALARNLHAIDERIAKEPPRTLFASVTNNTASLDVIRNGLGSASKQGEESSSSDQAATSSSSRPSGSPSRNPSEPLWKEVHEGKRTLVVNANSSAAILHLLEATKGHDKVKLALVAHGSDVYETLDALKKRSPTVILQPTLSNVPHTLNRVNVPRLAHEAGLDVAFSLSLSTTALNASQDTPLFPIAFLVETGLPREVAMKALTTTPAEIVGIEKEAGRIAPKFAAHLLVFDGDPLDAGSRLKEVYVKGVLVHEDTAQTAP